MTNGNNAARAKHLESAATATKRYILAEILDVTNAVTAELSALAGSGVLDTIPATVNGGMWYELTDNVPSSIKLKHGNHTLTLTPSIINISPNLTVTPSTLTVPVDGSITAAVSFDSAGSVTVTGSNDVTPTYNASTKVITVPYSYSAASSVITVELGASYGYLADTASFTVTMAKASPNLTVTPSANSTDGDDITATVSYSGGGTISVSSDNANVTPTYSSGTITVPYYAFAADTTVTVTVNVAANGNYSAQSATFQILYEECAAYLDPQLTLYDITDSRDDRVLGSSAYAIKGISYLGNGTITATTSDSDGARVETSTDCVWVYNGHTAGTYTCTVSLSASLPYDAATASFIYSHSGGGQIIPS